MNSTNCLQGHFLIASPYLPDPNFFRSVVLMVTHDEQHAFGLLLNRPGREEFGRVWEQVSGDVVNIDHQLRIGGPIEGPLMILHRQSSCSDAEVLPGVYLSSRRASVTELVAKACEPMIPLVGYSGWGPQQLESELEAGGWMTIKATKELVFAHPDEQWTMATKQISEKILSDVGVRHVPPDPRWN